MKQPKKAKKEEKKPLNNEEAFIDLTNESPQKTESAGLGDTIKKITNFLGIEQCEPCKQRQEKLNKLFPYLKTTRELTQDEIDLMGRVNASKRINNEDANALFKLYNTLFSKKLERCNCPGVVKTIIERINNFV